MDRLTIPNQAKTNSGDTICFFSYVSYIIKGKCLISDKSVFLINNQLSVPGMIVERITSTSVGFAVDQDYYKIIQSNVQYKAGTVVVVKAASAYKFNVDGKQYAYVDESNVLLNIGHEVIAGLEFELVEKVEEGKLFKQVSINSGLLNGEETYFNDFEYEITIGDTDYYLVKKDLIYAMGGS